MKEACRNCWCFFIKLRVLSEGAASNSCCKVWAPHGDIFSRIGNMVGDCSLIVRYISVIGKKNK